MVRTDFSFEETGGERDGALQQFRLIVDFRSLNAVTEMATYIPPDVKQLVMDLRNAKVFSTTDMCSSYYQMQLFGPDRSKTTFACHTPEGVKYFRFRVACLGLSGAVAEWVSVVYGKNPEGHGR